MEYPWYIYPEQAEGIKQGDFVFGFSLIEPVQESSGQADSAEADVRLYDFIVISHSCDITDGTIEQLGVIQLLPIYTYADFVARTRWNREKQDALIKDRITAHHLLQYCDMLDKMPSDHFVVDFMDLKVAPYAQILEHVNTSGRQRLRLGRPYLEKMTSRFANIYMRVGLPTDVDKPDTISVTATS